MQVMHFYRDAAGDPRAVCAEARELLGRYLESDLQGSAGHAREILGVIDRVVAGETRSWQETGNAHTLILEPEGATIESEMEEEAAPCRIPLDELRDAVTGWLAFLERTGDR
jgi:uncharacterized protein YacL (UPF0231 family)